MREPVRPVVEGDDPLQTDPRRTRRGPIDPALLGLAPELRRHLVVCAGLAAVTTVAVLAQAEVIGRQLPRLLDGDLGASPPLVAALCTLGVARFLVRWTTEVSASRAASGARATITGRVTSVALVLDERGSAEASPARVTTLVTDGVDALDPWIRSYVPALCLAVLLPLAAGARILLADLPSAVILLVAIPLIPVFMVLIGKLAEDRANRQWATLQHLAAHFHDVLVGLPTLRLFGQAGAQVERVRAVAERYRVAVMRTLRVAFLSAAAMELLAMLSVALVAVTIGYRLSVGSVSLQTALIVLLLAPECSLPIRRVGAAFHAAQAGTDAADELREVLGASTTPDGPVDELPAHDPDVPVLLIRGATAVDPERGHRVGPVDAEIGSGEVVALVGPSGAGKSTLLDVIRCRVPLHRGAVELAGVDVTQLSRTERRGAIAWIPQLPEPVGSDVRTAVAADGGTDGAPAALIEEVLRSVDLSALAGRAPSELSGGERQRLAVARGVLDCRTRPGVRLLLADEPTSHLDHERTGMVLTALQRAASEGAAVVVATHDPQLIAGADHVVLLDSSAGPRPGDPAAAEPRPGEQPSAGRSPAEFPSPDRLSGDAPASPMHPDAIGDGTATPSGKRPSPDDLVWFRRMARPQRWRLLGARSIGIATELCTIGLAATAAWMLVRASEGTAFAELAVAAVAVRTFAIGKGVLRYGERLVSHDTTFRLLADVRGSVVARLGRIAPAGVPGMERGDVMSRVVDDVDRMADQELRVTGPMVSGLAVGLVAVVGAGMVGIAFGLAYAAAVVVVAIVLPAVAYSLAAGAADEQISARTDLASATLELVEHADEITAAAAPTAWTDRISAAVTSLGHSERRSGTRVGLAEGAAALTAPLLAASVVLADRSLGGAVSAPTLAVLVLVPFALLEVLAPLLHSGEQQASVLTAARRLRTVLEAPEPVEEPDDPLDVPSNPSLRLDEVTLRWPRATAPALTGVDLDLGPGARAAVSGPSGVGKSTLAAALVRFIGVEEGRYLLGGVDAALAGGENVRETVTWCQQSPWLASTSLRENLHVAAPGATDDELWKALDAVQLSDWAVGLPEGLSTPVGLDGSAMSGGQRQRLALARVLLAGHSVVVLDEPTANLDSATAERVLSDLLVALRERTVLLLGHDSRSVGPGWQHLDLTVVGSASVPSTATERRSAVRGILSTPVEVQQQT